MTYSLQRLLIILGLITIPFYEIILHMLPYVKNVAHDSRAPKEAIALVFALSIGLLAVFQGTLKPFKNKYFLIVPLYLLFNLIIAPRTSLIINGVESGDFYFWKPFAEVLCFTLMIVAVSSIRINIGIILKTMVFCGVVMAIYMILQKFQMDQFWIPRVGFEFIEVRGRIMGGNLGHPTIAASFVLMMVPLAMYLKKYWTVLIMVTAIFLAQGLMAIVTLGIIWTIAVFYLYRELQRPFTILLIVIGIISSVLFFKNESFHHKIGNFMDGRLQVWGDVINDIHYGQIIGSHSMAITGVGLGRFPFIFPDKHKSEFMQAHNDILEFVYNCGLIGGFLLIGGVFMMIKSVHLTPMSFSILLSFIAIFFYSIGSFPFQLGAHQFYSAVLVGLLHNDSITRRV